MCIDRIESLDVAHIADTLNIFLRRYFLSYLLHCGAFATEYIIWKFNILFSFSGDFNIPLNYKNSTKASVFWCTKKAVFQLMRERRPIPPWQLYPAMLWSKLLCNSVVVV